MIKIVRTLSTRVGSDGKAEILLRATISRETRIRLKSGLFISPKRFREGEIIKPRANQREVAELSAIENELIRLEQHIDGLCQSKSKKTLTKEYIIEQVDRFKHPDCYKDEKPAPATLFDHFDEFLETHTHLSEWRLKHYRVLYRALQRYELYKSLSSGEDFRLTLDGFTLEVVNDFERFMRNETEIYDKYPQIYVSFPADTHKCHKSHKPQKRGNNTIVCTFARLRAFFNWCREEKRTDCNPFSSYKGVTAEVYGTPYYITIEERKAIANHDFSAMPELEAQRDIFVFHCLIGCRVSDLIRLTSANVINGAIEYYANKTKDEHPVVIRVPLVQTAMDIIKKYEAYPKGEKLLPFITPQRYNDAIKRIFTLCGITRLVTILNPTTSREEQKPINEIASSHIARRTFVGNLYKKVKDPNLIGAMSGHVEGSKAFARYRTLDDDTKRDVINLLG